MKIAGPIPRSSLNLKHPCRLGISPRQKLGKTTPRVEQFHLGTKLTHCSRWLYDRVGSRTHAVELKLADSFYISKTPMYVLSSSNIPFL